MEVDRRSQPVIPLGQLESKEFELLDRIDRVNGALHREMYVVHLHQQQRLFDDAQTLLPGESRLPLARTEEGAEAPRGLAGCGRVGDLQQFESLADFDFSHGPRLWRAHGGWRYFFFVVFFAVFLAGFFFPPPPWPPPGSPS
jgi:hypothetical protein